MGQTGDLRAGNDGRRLAGAAQTDADHQIMPFRRIKRRGRAEAVSRNHQCVIQLVHVRISRLMVLSSANRENQPQQHPLRQQWLLWQRRLVPAGSRRRKWSVVGQAGLFHVFIVGRRVVRVYSFPRRHLGK